MMQSEFLLTYFYSGVVQLSSTSTLNFTLLHIRSPEVNTDHVMAVLSCIILLIYYIYYLSYGTCTYSIISWYAAGRTCSALRPPHSALLRSLPFPVFLSRPYHSHSTVPLHHCPLCHTYHWWFDYLIYMYYYLIQYTTSTSSINRQPPKYQIPHSQYCAESTFISITYIYIYILKYCRKAYKVITK